MLLSIALYASDWYGGMEAGFEQLFRWLAMMLTVPVLVWPGRTFFTGAAAALRGGRLTIDVPVAARPLHRLRRKRLRDGLRRGRRLVRLGGDVRHPAERRPVPGAARPPNGPPRRSAPSHAPPRSSRPGCVRAEPTTEPGYSLLARSSPRILCFEQSNQLIYRADMLLG